MKTEIQSGFAPPSALEWTRANYGISALSVHERAISILRAQEQDIPSMKLNVNGGAYSYNGAMRLFLGGESPEFVSPDDGTRLDILYLDGDDGTLGIATGVAAVAITDPLDLPAIPNGAIPLVAVHLGADQETITESDLYDLRAFITGWQSPAPGTFVPGFWSSTDWDGDAKNGADGVIDLSVAFGLPAGIKAVAVRFTVRGGTAGTYARLSATSGSLNKGLVTRVQVANQACDTGGIVPCDDNGDIYFSQGAALTEVYIYISGYFI